MAADEGNEKGMKKKQLKTIAFRCFAILLILCAVGLLASLYIDHKVKSEGEKALLYTITDRNSLDKAIVDEATEFEADCIIVLGAGIKDPQTPSDMLKDRLDAGIELYKKGAAPKLLLTGDNGRLEHNEIHVMLTYAEAAGVPEEDIFCDHAGFSTYDSMYRAKSIFQVKRAIVVTQEYHEYRALYLGKKLGLDVMGIASDQETYGGQAVRELREFLARNKDYFKERLSAKPIYGGDAIPINGSGLISHGE